MRFCTLAAMLVLAISITTTLPAQSTGDTLRFLNPPSLAAPHGYSQIVEVPAGSRVLYIAGQVPLDSTGRLVGAGDFRGQVTQVFENLRRALAAGGATFRDVVKINFYVTDVSQLAALRDVRDRFIDPLHPPASTLVEVRALFRPDVMLEVDAEAVAHGR